MEIDNLKLEWAEYRYKLTKFEEQKEIELKTKYPGLSPSAITKKLVMAVNKKFEKEAGNLLAKHLLLTSQTGTFK